MQAYYVKFGHTILNDGSPLSLKSKPWVITIAESTDRGTELKILKAAYCLMKVKSLSHVWLFATPWTVASTRLLRPWDFLGKSTGVGCHFLLQGIFLTQGLNPGLLHCRQTLYRLSHQGSPYCLVLYKMHWGIAR